MSISIEGRKTRRTKKAKTKTEIGRGRGREREREERERRNLFSSFLLYISLAQLELEHKIIINRSNITITVTVAGLYYQPWRNTVLFELIHRRQWPWIGIRIVCMRWNGQPIISSSVTPPSFLFMSEAGDRPLTVGTLPLSPSSMLYMHVASILSHKGIK